MIARCMPNLVRLVPSQPRRTVDDRRTTEADDAMAI